MRKFGEVLDYRTADKAVVGKKYIFGDSLRTICENQESFHIRNLIEIRDTGIYPFRSNNNTIHQFCREVIEEEDRMTNIQLSEWLAKGNGQKAYLKNSDAPEEGFGLGVVSTCYEYVGMKDDEPCYGAIRIRSWDSDE